MPKLEGSCHCGAVRFTVVSHTPEPYQHCYCSICRKTQGGGGYAINIMGEADTLKVAGAEHVKVYQARGTASHGDAPGPARRHFCMHCASYLYITDPRDPKLVHPFASAIDTALPVPPERTHVMLHDKAAWVEVMDTPEDMLYGGYPDLSIEEWHRRNGLYRPD
jgi:hypothetical protein